MNEAENDNWSAKRMLTFLVSNLVSNLVSSKYYLVLAQALAPT